jgi:hypothetical protein
MFLRRQAMKWFWSLLLVLAAWGGERPAVGNDKVVINDDRKQPLKMVMLEPWYRQTVFASLPIQKIKLELFPSIHINPGAVQGSSLRVEIVDAQNAVAGTATQTDLPLTQFLRQQVPITGLTFGHYRVVARMFDSQDKLLTDVFGNPCQAQTPLFLAPPAPQEVVFDQAGICRVNGESFFPIAMYHYEADILSLANGLREEKGLKAFTHEEWYRDARSMGLNAGHDSFDADNEKALLAAQERGATMCRAGFRALANPPDYREVKAEAIQVLAKNPGLLGWYTFDEPTLNYGDGSIMSRVAPTYARLREIDPYHPQCLCDNSISAMSREAPFADVLMPDFYPQRDGDMRVVGKAVATLKLLNNGRTVVWPVIQAFQLPNYTKKPDGRPYTFGMLTYPEMRAVVFDAVACGATGLSYYAYYTSEGPQLLPGGGKRDYYMLDDFPEQRQSITQINRQLTQLIPAITTGELLTSTLLPQRSDAHVRAFAKDGKGYVLVVNPSRESLDLRVGVLGLADQKGRDLYSSTEVSVAGGYFQLKMAPLDVYAFPLTVSFGAIGDTACQRGTIAP